ncbi:MAG TPA: hypothetical protein VLT84_06785, partial [Acidobacteriota bacterium]|nr:hypothetical protein [Acidobacteriota bacterium]
VTPPNVPGLTIERAGTSQNLVLAAGTVMRTDIAMFRVFTPGPGTYVLPSFLVSSGKQRVETSRVSFEVTASLPAVGSPEPGSAAPAGAPIFARLVVDRSHVVWNEQIVGRLQVFARGSLEDMPAWEPPAAAGFWGEPLGEATHDRVTIGGAIFERYERRFAFFPTRTGRLTLGPARAIVRVAHRNAPTYDPFAGMLFNAPPGARFTEVPIEAAPVSITVDPLPSGAPPEFRGAVGSLSMAVGVDRVRARAGEPITVSTMIRGEGNLASARDPALVALPAFPSYPAGSNTELDRSGARLRGARRRDVSFVPDRPGSLIVLPIAFSWFDPEEGRYRIQRSDSVLVRIGPAAPGTGGSSALSQSATSVPAPPRGAGANAGGAATPGALDGLPSGWPLLVGSVSVAAYAGFGAAAVARGRRARDPRRRRFAQACEAFREIESAARHSGAAAAPERAARALRELAGVRYGVDQEGKSRREFLDHLRSAEVAPEMVGAVDSILSRFEAEAFAPRDAGHAPGTAQGTGPPSAFVAALDLASRWRDECRP